MIGFRAGVVLTVALAGCMTPGTEPEPPPPPEPASPPQFPPPATQVIPDMALNVLTDPTVDLNIRDHFSTGPANRAVFSRKYMTDQDVVDVRRLSSTEVRLVAGWSGTSTVTIWARDGRYPPGVAPPIGQQTFDVTVHFPGELDVRVLPSAADSLPYRVFVDLDFVMEHTAVGNLDVVVTADDGTLYGFSDWGGRGLRGVHLDPAAGWQELQFRRDPERPRPGAQSLEAIRDLFSRYYRSAPRPVYSAYHVLECRRRGRTAVEFDCADPWRPRD